MPFTVLQCVNKYIIIIIINNHNTYLHFIFNISILDFRDVHLHNGKILVLDIDSFIKKFSCVS